MKRKQPSVSSIGEENSSSRDMKKLLGELQPAKKLMKNLLKKDLYQNQVSEVLQDSELLDSENFEETSEKICADQGDNIDKELVESEEENWDSDSETEEVDDSISHSFDPFFIHFEQTLDEKVVDQFNDLQKMEKSGTSEIDSLLMEEYTYNIKESKLDSHLVKFQSTQANFQEAFVKERLLENWKHVNKAKKSKENLTKLQRELLKPLSSYQDLYFADRNFENGEQIRKLYSLHSINHVLKTRNKILKHNSKLQNAAENDIEIDDLRDQGITRAKVLILAPFKDSCYKIVNIMKKVLFGAEKKVQIMNKKRFQNEFSSDEPAYKGFRPEDFKNMFEGNIDDCFRMGVSLSKNTMKLFTPFYSSDIIIASPIGLRMVIGGKGEKQDFDFLSSIEVLIIDQADVFLMQNWEHVITILDNINKTPKSTHDTDISRVRMWAINEWSKYYRQTLLFSSFQTPEINSIFNKHCFNFAGKNKWVVSNVSGTVQQVVSEIPQVFRRIEVQSYASLPDKRFNYFTNHILPDLKKHPNSIAIFIPSYFDFVRIRNYMKKEEINFVHISEYTKKAFSSHARTMFKEGRKQFLIFTGRFFFYYRYRITGINHLVFYDIPQYPHFYSEIVNFMETKNNSLSPSCTSLFSRYDAYKLERIVGTDRMKKMLSGKSLHMIVTGQ